MKTFIVLFVLLECIFIMMFITGMQSHRSGTIILFLVENFFLLIAFIVWLINKGSKRG